MVSIWQETINVSISRATSGLSNYYAEDKSSVVQKLGKEH